MPLSRKKIAGSIYRHSSAFCSRTSMLVFWT